MGTRDGSGGDLGRGPFEGLKIVFKGFLGVGGQVTDPKKIRQGAGRPSVVLGPERLTHFRHNHK